MTRRSIAAISIVGWTWFLNNGLAQNATNPLATVVSAATQTTDRVNITTRNGMEYKNCKITRVEPDGITVMYAKGIAKIPFADLPADVQDRYQYDPEKAINYQADAAKARTVQPIRNQTIWLDKLAVGAVGRLLYPHNVVSPYGGNPARVEIVQIVDAENMLGSVFGQTIWFKGVRTSGLVDGKTILMDGVYTVTGTRRYTTAIGGSKTVFVVEPYKKP